MNVIIQRVKFARVIINNSVYSEISNGLLVLLGVRQDDDSSDVNFIANKICNLKVFEDEKGHLGKSLKETNLDLMLVSNFTLCANTQKNRLSFLEVAKPTIALGVFENTSKQIEHELGKQIKTGDFGKFMNLQFDNDGPVTIIIDSKNRNN
jgi:D-aminoacyl-tRNA deacylase